MARRPTDSGLAVVRIYKPESKTAFPKFLHPQHNLVGTGNNDNNPQMEYTRGR